MVEFEDALKLLNTNSPEVSQMEHVYLQWGATQAQDKTIHRKLVVTTLGYIRDGVFGAQYSTAEQLASLLSLSAWVICQNFVSPKVLQIVGGKWSRVVQLCREAGHLLDPLWRAISPDTGRTPGGRLKVSIAIKEALFCLMCFQPLLLTDYRLSTDAVCTASSASEEGCGVTRSMHGTKLGAQALQDIETNSHLQDGGGIGLVEVFSSLAGIRQALALNSVQPSVFILIEANPKVVRAVQMQWPQVQVWGGAETIDLEKVKSALVLATHVKLWIIGGSFTCPNLPCGRPPPHHSHDRRGPDVLFNVPCCENCNFVSASFSLDGSEALLRVSCVGRG